MDLFTVAAKLRLDSGDFEKNLRKMDHEGKGFADSLAKSFDKVKKIAVAIGSAFAVKKVADGLWSVANAAAQAGDKIDKQSQALGMSRKAYQEWEYILSQSGASIDSMGVSMKTLNSAILEGSDDTRQALSKLHLSTTELKHMSQEDAFKKVVEAFQKIPAGAQKSALAVQLFGRNGQELLPLLNSSAESIDELRRQANELGLVMSDDDVNAAVAFGDALDTLKRTFTSFKYRFGAQILPALTSGMGKITDYAGKLRKAYDARGFAGVFDTVVSDVKNIKWPSWSDVRAAAEAGWETIKKGVAGLGKLVFGENEKGEVKWPTWDDVATAAGEAWETIKKGVAGFGGLVFGKTEDGKVNWPDLGTAIEWAKTNLWDNGVVAAVAAFGGLVFGKNEKGEVKWPTIEDMQNAAKDLWGKLKTFVANVFNLGGKLIFGTDKTSGEVKWPSIDDFKQGAKDLWGQLKTFVANAFNLGGKLIFGENTAGEVKWPDVSTLQASAAAFWQNTALPALKGLFSFTKDVFDFTLDTLGLPDIDTIVNQVNEWWNGENGVVARIKGKITSLIPKNFLDTVVEESLDMTLGSIANKENSALGLLDKLISMGDSSKLTAEQQAAWKATAQELINIFPQLSEVIDLDKQSINGNTAEIRENIKAWSDLARERAIADAKEKKQQLLVERNSDLIESQINLEREQQKLYEAREGMIDRYNKVLEKYGMNERIDPSKDFGEQFNSIIDKYSNAGDEYESFWQEFGGAGSEVGKVTTEILKLQNEVEANKEKLQAAEAEYAEWEAALNSLFGQVSTNGEGARTQVEGVTTSLNNVPKRTDAYIYIHTIGNIPSISGNVPSFQSKKGNVTYTLNAKGNWDVPYDNYPALLHRNEMVLNATQARQYREGSNGFDLQGFAQAVIGAVRAGMENASVNAYVNGRKLTREANRGLFQDMKGRRFAG